MRRVLAAFDLTPASRRVLSRARMVAEEQDAMLALVHVDEPLREAFLDEAVEKLLRKHRREEAERLADWIRERTEFPIDLTVVRGSPASVISRLGRDSDLVVAGTSSLDPARVGPITGRLARKARTSVLAVRRQPRVPYRRVVVAVDLSEPSRAAVDLARQLAPEAEVNVVFALSYRFEGQLTDAGLFPEEVHHLRRGRRKLAEDALTEFVSAWEGDLRAVLEEGPPSEVVGEVVRKRGADLVVVASRGSGANSLVLLGTVAEGVMESVPCDVAVARAGTVFRRR